MKKPLAIVMAVLTVLLALPPGWADDAPASATFAQLTAVLQGEGWKFDTDKKVFTKDGKTLYVQGDGSVVATPPSTQKPTDPAPKQKGLAVTEPPQGGGVDNSHVIAPKEESSTLSQVAHNHLTWMVGGAATGALIFGLLAGPIGFLVGAIGGMLTGMMMQHLIQGKDAK